MTLTWRKLPQNSYWWTRFPDHGTSERRREIPAVDHIFFPGRFLLQDEGRSQYRQGWTRCGHKIQFFPVIKAANSQIPWAALRFSSVSRPPGATPAMAHVLQHQGPVSRQAHIPQAYLTSTQKEPKCNGQGSDSPPLTTLHLPRTSSGRNKQQSLLLAFLLSFQMAKDDTNLYYCWLH